MLTHDAPLVLQRRHLSAYVIGCVPLQVPIDPCRVEPTWVGPEIEGAWTFLAAVAAVAAVGRYRGRGGRRGRGGTSWDAGSPEGWVVTPEPVGSGDAGVGLPIGATRLPVTAPTRPPVAYRRATSCPTAHPTRPPRAFAHHVPVLPAAFAGASIVEMTTPRRPGALATARRTVPFWSLSRLSVVRPRNPTTTAPAASTVARARRAPEYAATPCRCATSRGCRCRPRGRRRCFRRPSSRLPNRQRNFIGSLGHEHLQVHGLRERSRATAACRPADERPAGRRDDRPFRADPAAIPAAITSPAAVAGALLDGQRALWSLRRGDGRRGRRGGCDQKRRCCGGCDSPHANFPPT